MHSEEDIVIYATEAPQGAKGMKFDKEKPRMDLLDADALEGLAKVLTFGAQKYAANNWRNGIEYSRLTAAILRHLMAIQRGEDLDPESGLPHIDHLGCCWMFLSNLTKNRTDLDDRWKKNEQSKTNLDNSERRRANCVYGSCEQSCKPGESCHGLTTYRVPR